MNKKENKNGHRLARQARAGGQKLKNLIEHHYKHNHPAESSTKSPKIIERQEKIAERRADMPKIYRATYKKAVAGNSLRSAVNSFCAECVMWQREEVRLCTSLACQFYPYRPYRDTPKKTDKP